jgi:hypothetical protein
MAKNAHKEIDSKVDDQVKRPVVLQETSSDGKFSTYEVAPKTDPLAGDLILQYRGAPKDDK